MAPGDHLHAEGGPDASDLSADLAQPQQTQSSSVQVGAYGVLPRAAFSQSGVLGDQVTGQAQDQGPGQLRGGFGVAGSSAHGDLVFSGCLEVDGGVAHAAGDQQLQPRQAPQQCGRKGSAFPHDDHDVERGQSFGHRVLVVQVVGEHRQLHLVAQLRPVGELTYGVLVVVDHCAP